MTPLLTQDELDTLAMQELPGKASTLQIGHLKQRERIALLAERCCQKREGDLIELGVYSGDTSKILAIIARKYGRKLICVDPFPMGTPWELGEKIHAVFETNMRPFSDVVIFHHADAHSPEMVAEIQKRRYAFSMSDDGHELWHHIVELRALLPVTDGLLLADDVYLADVEKAIDDVLPEFPGWSVLRNERLGESYLTKDMK